MPGPKLLVSVRDSAEATAALAGGADLIDVKEPKRGSLGRADVATIVAVVRAVGGRTPVSAALGELREWPLVGAAAEIPDDVGFVKWGLSGLSDRRWDQALFAASRLLPFAQMVVVAYADWARAEAPRPADVAAVIVQAPWKILLIDTWIKDGSTLLDWLSTDELSRMIQQCRDAGKRVALAGSLSAAEIDRLRDVRPDWFAVRGAVCEGGREGSVSEVRVRELAHFLHLLQSTYASADVAGGNTA